ncbi:MAG TPA: M17 family peptidase N-terminal domain-containing protein, partial [Solirubrobacterales bacterium]|nr:M17 family peptidase N-terminal domain-containing protein [Solirubrobacterales bacterium]
MRVAIQDIPLENADADLVCIGLFKGEELPEPLREAPGAADARPAYRRLTVLHPQGPARVAVIGLGPRDEFGPERARVAAAISTREAARREARTITWLPPDDGEPAALASALVEGTILAAYRFDRFKQPEGDEPRPRVESLTLLGQDDLSAAAAVARTASEAANRARELQNLPGNVATPSHLAERAEEIAAGDERVSVEVMGRDEIE